MVDGDTLEIQTAGFDGSSAPSIFACIEDPAYLPAPKNDIIIRCDNPNIPISSVMPAFFKIGDNGEGWGGFGGMIANNVIIENCLITETIAYFENSDNLTIRNSEIRPQAGIGVVGMAAPPMFPAVFATNLKVTNNIIDLLGGGYVMDALSSGIISGVWWNNIINKTSSASYFSGGCNPHSFDNGSSGNFWANDTGTGFSQTCTDSDLNGICDSPYVTPCGTDNFPLSISPVSPVIPNATTTHYCDSCTSCTAIVENGTLQDGNTLLITNDLDVNGSFNTSGCFDIAVGSSFLDNITIDCQGYTFYNNCTYCNAIFLAYPTGFATINTIVKNCNFNGYFGYAPVPDRAAIGIAAGSFNTITNITIDNCTFDSYETGIFIGGAYQNTIKNSVFRNGLNAIRFGAGANNNTIINNTFSNTSIVGYGVASYQNISSNILYESQIKMQNIMNSFFYNNIFNVSSSYLNGASDSSNNWNTTKLNGTNIVGGNQTGGNFWAFPNGTGYSQTCSNANNDSFCDNSYTFNPTDYLPLTLNMPVAVTIEITIYSPQNITYSNVSQVDLQVSANETINTWWYSINGGSNTTFTPNTTINIANGSNILFVYANDTIGNVGQSSVSFTGNYPTVTYLDSPDDGNTTISGVPINMTFNCSAINDINLANITLYLNGVPNETVSITGIWNFSIFTKSLSLGTYNWTCRACDFADQCSFGVPTRTLSVTAPPTPRAIDIMGFFAPLILFLLGAGVILFLIEGFFASGLDLKRLVTVVIGAIIVVALIVSLI
jgi:hypothetical protein